MSAQVANANNQGVTQRLEMQLASLESARNQAAQAEQQRMALENSYNQQRLALAQKQADQNMAIAKATLSAQLTQAGLSEGGVTSSASTGLAVSSTPGAMSSNAGVVSNGQVASLASGSGGGGLGFLSSARGFTSSTESSEPAEEETATVKTPGVTSVRGIAGASANDRLLAALRSQKPAAPTAAKATVATKKPGNTSDMSKFISATKPVVGGLADYQRHSAATVRGIASQSGALTSNVGHGAAAYNAP